MLPFLVIGVFTGAAYALMAVGFVLTYRGTGILNLAHGEVGGVGLYVSWSLLHVLPVWAACLVGLAASVVTALVLEATLVRRLADRPPLTALASLLGAGLTLAWLESLLFGTTIKTFPSPVGTQTWTVGSLTVTAPRVAALVVAAVVACALAIFLRRTRFGLAVAAATSDSTLARISGVPVRRVRQVVWGVSGLLSGLAAILLATVYTFHPLSSTFILVRAMAAALVGGLASIVGAFAGGLVIGTAESLVISWTSIGGMVDATVLALILGVLLLRPEGMFGARPS